MNKSRKIGGGAVLIVVLAAVWWLNASSDRTAEEDNASIISEQKSIIIPDFTQSALAGEIAFNGSCAVCHGTNAVGTEQGPPLIHKFYGPRRHADYAFVIAAKSGVRAHHWRFGNMPPVEGITDDKIQLIITYIREIQAANGI